MHGGDLVAQFLEAQGLPFVFTLTGGHIAPILVGCKQRGIRVIDTRHEATAVFAADAVARLTGRPAVAVVTAGPGVTNTLTAVKNAQMAQSPVVLIGGAVATALKGRGALQDIEQLALFRSVVKWSHSVRRVRDLVPALTQAFQQAQNGVPGPVFLEIPIDLLYDQALVRQWYGLASGGRSLADWATKQYLKLHVARLFADPPDAPALKLPAPMIPALREADLAHALKHMQHAQRPVLVVGSQALLDPDSVPALVQALEQLGMPLFLSGMARGLLGRNHPLLLRHRRRDALREADLVLLAGVPCDFRLDYGRQIRRSATYIAVNRSTHDLQLNRRPNLAVHGDPTRFLVQLAAQLSERTGSQEWLARLRTHDEAREAEIAAQAQPGDGMINPLQLCRAINTALPANALIVADGGDFISTAAYTVAPPGPLCWLDPGPFGTLGVGAGFAIGAKLCRPEAEVWTLFGDGALGYSLSEFDSFVRHGLPVIAVVGNDAGWTQIAREQTPMLGDPVGTQLAHSAYEHAVQGLGATGLVLRDPALIDATLAQARTVAAQGQPVLVNAIIGTSEFRKGSLSM